MLSVFTIFAPDSHHQKKAVYKKFIRPILFHISPENIHHIMMWGFRLVQWIPGATWLLRKMFAFTDPSLEREVFGMTFPNPVGLAAGFDKDAYAYRVLGAMGFGFVEVGTVTPLPQKGNKKPRLFRLEADNALVNRMGFNNLGMDRALDHLRNRRPGQIVGANLGKNTDTPNQSAAADYLKLFRSLYQYVDYFVVNVSCPNIASLTALQDKESLREISNGLVEFRRGQNQYRPILLKISPDLTFKEIDDAIEVMTELGLDGLVAVNTTSKREGLQSDPREIEAIGKGGLSGEPIRERALEVVRYIHKKTEGRYPIIGVGGIMTPDDALAMLDAGASLIQVYTGYVYGGPAFVRQICKKIKKRAEGKPEPAPAAANSTAPASASESSAEA